jgi:hypothetical protein
MKKLLFVAIVLSSVCSTLSWSDDSKNQNSNYYPISTWGQAPAKVTKDMVCLQNPSVCENKDEDTQPVIKNPKMLKVENSLSFN